MKVGYETIIWGVHLDNLQYILDIIKKAGYQGVEFAQRYDALGVKDIHELIALLNERDLTLLSLVGGTLEERIRFCENHRPEYLYVEPWELDRVSYVVDHGFVPALHPRVFTSVRRLTDALDLLEQHPKLQLILDTAHLTIAGDSPVEAIQKAEKRIASLHLKDWTPEFGRSSYRYGQGFTALGKGRVELKEAIDDLKKINYEGWIVAELDKFQVDPEEHIVNSAKWFVGQGLMSKSLHLTKDDIGKLPQMIAAEAKKCSPEAEAQFREAITFAATKGSKNFYQEVGKAFFELIPCKLVRIWACSPAQDQMALLVSLPDTSLDKGQGYQLGQDDVLSGIVTRRHAPVTHFDLTEEKPAARYGYPNRRYKHPDLQKELGLEYLVTLPIYNSGNQNYVRFLVNLFPEDNKLQITDREMYWFGRAVTLAADSMLEELCYSATVRVSLLAGECESVKHFLDELINLIQDCVDCEGVAIFALSDAGDELKLVASTGTEWKSSDSDRFYRKGEGILGTVWERSEPLLTVDARNEDLFEGKSTELVSDDDQYAGLWVPFINIRGKVVGVARCRNKRRTLNKIVPNMFSDDDASVLDAIGQEAIPHWEMLRLEEQRSSEIGRLTHELKGPLVAIRGASEFMIREFEKQSIDPAKFFRQDYPGDISSWSELMRRLLVNAEIFRYYSEGIPVVARPTLLMGEVIAPVVKQVGMLLRERNFSSYHITYGRFEHIPRLWIDPNQFQQVIFNLLSNAIKHCYSDPASFQVEIDGQKVGREYHIVFRDWGPGIERGFEKAIFEEGFRTGRTADNRGHKHQVSMSSKVSFEGRPRCMGGDQRGGGMRKSNSSTTDQR